MEICTQTHIFNMYKITYFMHLKTRTQIFNMTLRNFIFSLYGNYMHLLYVYMYHLYTYTWKCTAFLTFDIENSIFHIHESEPKPHMGQEQNSIFHTRKYLHSDFNMCHGEKLVSHIYWSVQLYFPAKMVSLLLLLSWCFITISCVNFG